MTSRFLLTFLSAVAVALSFACAPQGGGGSAVPAAPTGNGPVFEGTVSGGGGNGCKAKTFELDAKRISSLPEYQYVLKPLLRRMEEQGGDPLLTYLLWAAEEKVWYFIPCQLQKLSTEQVGVAIQSDQLALHGEHGIYIYSDPEVTPDPNLGIKPTYAQTDMKTRAGLLLHEMVMGARLLMKQTAKKQCTALAKKDTTLCSDPQVMAIAEANQIDPKQALVMDAADHEAVRAMTVFLAETGADFSAQNVKATRERLGFNFPWSRAASNLTFEGLLDAVARSRQAEDRYMIAGKSHYAGQPTSCTFNLPSWWSRDVVYFLTEFVSSHAVSKNSVNQAELLKSVGLKHFGQICTQFAGRIQSARFANQADNCESELLTWYGEGVGFQFGRGAYEARGTLRDGQIFDEISAISEGGKFNGRAVEATVVRMLVTREEAPRIYSVRFEPKQLLRRYAKTDSGSNVDEKNASQGQPEYLDIPGLPAIECVRQVTK